MIQQHQDENISKPLFIGGICGHSLMHLYFKLLDILKYVPPIAHQIVKASENSEAARNFCEARKGACIEAARLCAPHNIAISILE